MISDTSINVACTLIPVQGYHLLLPNHCISEVLMCSNIEDYHSPSHWCIGQVPWMHEKRPIVSFEKLEANIQLANKKKSIIIILQLPTSGSGPGSQSSNNEMFHFGLLANRIPQVVQANEQSLDREINPTNPHHYAMSYVMINGKPALIPDIQRIAKLLQKQVRKTA